jgi:hypothetical protein
MTADAAAHPIVRWDPRQAQLVSQDGGAATAAQDAKARQYLKRGCIRKVSGSNEVASWGMPWRSVDVYELTPSPGCRQTRTVRVTTWHDGVGGIAAIDYACDCQRAGGTTATRPTVCSHDLAVHRFRKEDTVLA